MAKMINAKGYSALIGVSAASVTKKLKLHVLPGTIKCEKIGNVWFITVPENFDKEKNKKKFTDLSW